MKSIVEILNDKISAAMADVTGQQRCAAIVGPATDPKFGDYQANGVMALAKKLKTNPHKLAEEVVNKLNTEHRTPNSELLLSDICEQPEVAGPGFINLRLKADFVAKTLLEISRHYVEEVLPGGNKVPYSRFGIDKVANPKKIVVDFSAPNIAKEMHVGHLRSTIIGDCICRVLEFLGHKVIRQNHIGNWGTQVGMLMAKLDEDSRKQEEYAGAPITAEQLKLPLVIFEHFYKQAKQRYDSDEQFAKSAREAVVRLHKNDPEYTVLWQIIVNESRSHYQAIYDTLGVNLKKQHERGESFYKDMLPGIVEELLKRKIAEKSKGAICVFPDKEKFKTKDGNPMPLIIRKSDEAHLYATTDLAALRYRVTSMQYEGKEYKADKIIYVTDARQKLHFEMLFAVARMAGWDVRQKVSPHPCGGGQKPALSEAEGTEDRGQRTEGQLVRRSFSEDGRTEFVHVTFGSVLGENGKPLKTREGENVKLKDLLNEAMERARKIVEEKNPNLPAAKKTEIAKAVGIGAVKYADFSNNRTSDYVFSFNKMLAMEGNTAPYMQYAYARIKSIERKAQSIERKAQSKDVDVETELAGIKSIALTDPAELDLAKHLIRYGEAIQSAAADYRPNYLTAYLYELAQKFSVFYTNCPVLDAGRGKRPTRLLLCDLTARTVKHGLSNLLGIEVVEQM